MEQKQSSAVQLNAMKCSVSSYIAVPRYYPVSLLGRGYRTKRSQNPGIAKKGEGGSDPCQDFFGGFDIVHRGQLKVIMDP